MSIQFLSDLELDLVEPRGINLLCCRLCATIVSCRPSTGRTGSFSPADVVVGSVNVTGAAQGGERGPHAGDRTNDTTRLSQTRSSAFRHEMKWLAQHRIAPHPVGEHGGASVSVKPRSSSTKYETIPTNTEKPRDRGSPSAPRPAFAGNPSRRDA